RGNLCDRWRRGPRSRGHHGPQGGAKNRPARRGYGGVAKSIAARGGRLDDNEARRQPCNSRTTRNRAARGAGGRESRKRGKARAAGRRRRTCAGKRGNASGTRGTEACRESARRIENRAASRRQG